MSITVDLKLETEARVKTQSLRNGVKIEDYVSELVEEASDRRERIERGTEKSFAEILAPIHKEFEESGMSEAELTEFLEELREEVWQEKQRAK